jgi:hypothetical protein
MNLIMAKVTITHVHTTKKTTPARLSEIYKLLLPFSTPLESTYDAKRTGGLLKCKK